MSGAAKQNRHFSYLLCNSDKRKIWGYITLQELSNFLASNDKGTLLVFGGNCCNDDKMAQGYGALIRSMIPAFKDDVNIVTTNYNHSIKKKPLTINVCEFIDQCLIPLVNPENGIDFDTAAKNLRKITILAHCFGGYGVVQTMEPIFHDVLLGFKYTKAQTEFLLSQIVCVTYGSRTKLKYVTEFNMMSIDDLTKKQDASAIWQELLEDADSVDMPSKDRAKLIKKYIKAKKKYQKIVEYNHKIKANSTGIKFNDHEFVFKEEKINLKFVNKYLKHHNRVFLHAIDARKVDIASGHLTNNNYVPEIPGNDHILIYSHFTQEYKPHYTATKTGEYMARAICAVFCHSIANTIINLSSTEFQPFDIQDTCDAISHFISPLNYKEQLKLDDSQLFNLTQDNSKVYEYDPLFDHTKDDM